MQAYRQRQGVQHIEEAGAVSRAGINLIMYLVHRGISYPGNSQDSIQDKVVGNEGGQTGIYAQGYAPILLVCTHHFVHLTVGEFASPQIIREHDVSKKGKTAAASQREISPAESFERKSMFEVIIVSNIYGRASDGQRGILNIEKVARIAQTQACRKISAESIGEAGCDVTLVPVGVYTLYYKEFIVAIVVHGPIEGTAQSPFAPLHKGGGFLSQRSYAPVGLVGKGRHGNQQAEH